jgi:phage-related protein
MVGEKGLGNVLGGLSKFQKNAQQTFGKVQGVMNDANKTMGQVKQIFGQGAGAIMDFVMTFLSKSEIFQSYMQEFHDILGYIGDVLMEVIAPILEPMLDILMMFGDVLSTMMPTIRTMMDPIILMLQDIAKWLADNPIAIKAIIVIIMALCALIAGPLIAAVVAFVAVVWLITKAFDAVKWVAEQLAKFLLWSWSQLGNIWNALVGGMRAAWNGLVGGIMGAWNALKGAWDTVIGGISDTWNGLMSGMKEMWDTIAKPIMDGIKYVLDNLGGVTDTVGGWFSGIKLPDLGFAEGGFGDFGSGTPAMLHGREYIIPEDKMGGMGCGLTVNISNVSFGSRNDIDYLVEQIERKIAQNTRRFA